MFDFIALAQECAPQVPPQTLAAIVKTESGFQPLAIGVNGGSRLARQPANKPEAVATARWLIEHGYNIDIGLGQVNIKNLAKTGLSLEEAFEPCANLRAAAKIFDANLRWAQGTGKNDQAAVLAALSAYNTGSLSAGFRNGYVQRVVANAGAASTTARSQDALPIPLIAAAPRPSARRSPVPSAAAAPGAPARLVAEEESSGADASVYGGRTQRSNGVSVMVY